MPVNFTAANQAVSVYPLDLIKSAMIEIGALMLGDDPTAEEAQWGLEKLQRITDQFNAQAEMIFSHNFTLFTLQANHAPHTIGPGGDFNTPVRPVKVVSATFLISSTVEQPINLEDDDWWHANPVKSQTGSISTHLYYDPALTLGNLNFWPICTGTNQVRLESWASLAQAIDLSTTKLAFVQGYWDAVVLSLAVSLWNTFHRGEPIDAQLMTNWRTAMKVVRGNNTSPPKIETNAGMPDSGRSGRPDFNFLTGLRE